MRHFSLTVQTVTLICAYFEPCLKSIIGGARDQSAPTEGRSILFICIISYRSFHGTFRLLFVGTGYILSNCLKILSCFHSIVRTCMLQ